MKSITLSPDPLHEKGKNVTLILIWKQMIPHRLRYILERLQVPKLHPKYINRAITM